MQPGRLTLLIAALAVLAAPVAADVQEDWVTVYDGPAGLDDAGCAGWKRVRDGEEREDLPL